jgi:hypothetical protein
VPLEVIREHMPSDIEGDLPGHCWVKDE